MFENLSNAFSEMLSNIVTALDLTSPLRYIILFIDLSLVILLVYFLYKFIKKTRAEQIFKGVLLLFVIFIIAKALNLVILNFILTNFMAYGIFMIIVVFQPELRKAFEKLGRSKIVGVFDTNESILIKHSISEIVKAVEIMSLKQIGALIVIERKTKIAEVLREGVNLSAKISSELIQNIFMPRTPLHDGAIVIDGTQILAAKCILPLASEGAVPKNLGTRHRAAVGITEISDALVIVVSEETGIISLVEDGKLTRELTGDSLKELLLN